MNFSKRCIFLYVSIFYFQNVLNELLFKKNQTDFAFSLYNIIFSLSYCAIITKVLFNHCNIIIHCMATIFIYMNKYIVVSPEIISSYKFLYKQFSNITVWNCMCVRYNYRNSLKPFITLSSIYNLLDITESRVVNLLLSFEMISIYIVHINCFMNVILIILNLKIKERETKSNVTYFDLISKKFVVLFIFTVLCNFLFFSEVLSEFWNMKVGLSLFIFHNLVSFCVFKTKYVYFVSLLPIFLVYTKYYMNSGVLLKYIINITYLPILYMVCLQYRINGRIYALNICYIMVPTIIEYLEVRNEYINYLIAPIAFFLYNINEIIKLNIQKEIETIEENSIKNNIDIIINE